MASGHERTKALLKDLNTIIFSMSMNERKYGIYDAINEIMANDYDLPIEDKDEINRFANAEIRYQHVMSFFQDREKETVFFYISPGIARLLEQNDKSSMNYANFFIPALSHSTATKQRRLSCKLDKVKINEFENKKYNNYGVTEIMKEIGVIAASIAIEFLRYFFSLGRYNTHEEEVFINYSYAEFLRIPISKLPNLLKQLNKEKQAPGQLREHHDFRHRH